MVQRLAWLWMAAMLALGASAIAQAPAATGAKAPDKSNAAAKVRADVKSGERPTSLDRPLAPNDFPTNTVKILRTTNKAQTNSYVPIVFDFTKTNPFNVIRYLRRPVQAEEGALFTFVNPDGNGGKVLFVVPDYMVPSLRELVAAVDRPGLTTSDGAKKIYQQLKHRRADTSDPDFIETVASFSTGNSSRLVTDPEENALYFEDAPSGSEALQQALKDWLDVPTAMVEMVVKVYEVDATNDSTIGLDYMAWKNGPGRNLFAAGAFAEYGSMGRDSNAVFDPIGTGARGLPHDSFNASGWNYSYRYEVNSAYFDYLAVKGKARILNSVKLAALNSHTASMTAGDQILYYAVKTTDEPSGVRDTGDVNQANEGRSVVGTTNQLVDDQLTPVQTGLTLEVTPVIGEKSVQMELALDWSDYSLVDSTGLPAINPRSLNTKLEANLGEEIIIGGIDRQVALNSTKKMPILGSIPILGYAFGGDTAQTKKTEMIVVLHPTAVFNYDVAQDYRVQESEQAVIDKATGQKAIEEPKANWGFEMPGLDPEAGAKAQ